MDALTRLMRTEALASERLVGSTIGITRHFADVQGGRPIGSCIATSDISDVRDDGPGTTGLARGFLAAGSFLNT